MSISFNEVPSSARVPGVYIEIDNSLANSAEDLQLVLVIGNFGAGGSAVANEVHLTMDETKAAEIFGDSDIVDMVKWFRGQDETMPIYGIAVENTDLMSALAALGDTQYHHILCSLSDETSVRDLGTFLEDRYKALNQIPGIGYIPFKGTHAELITFANKSNCPLINFMPINKIGDSSNAEVSEAAAIGAWAGQIAPSLATDPARPLQTLKLSGLYTLSPDEWDWAERNLLLYEGMSTYKTSSAKEILIERPVTAYTENASGIADNSYLDVMTPATVMFIRQKQRARILSKYGRHKLAKDGTRFAPGQAIVTPSILKSELLVLYKELELDGLVQDFEGYKESLIVTLDTTNKQRINYQDSPQLVNGMIITAGKIQFRN
ncbi:MAG: phage tail sheath subtilisin-like domain-containing protein [Pseudomonadota bacterium]